MGIWIKNGVERFKGGEDVAGCDESFQTVKADCSGGEGRLNGLLFLFLVCISAG